ncbi:MAG TPA: GDSL-type esterase/lipase family protein [Myxococcales bacterium]|nr:GDSL-type esterase/lipase family protein [Myxococcales bacterium]
MLNRTLLATAVLSLSTAALADKGPGGGNDNNRKWVASWTTSPQNVFTGSGTVQTAALVNFAFPPAAGAAFNAPRSAQNQTLRMIVKPDIWSDTMRIRLSNTYGTAPITFGHVAIGLQSFSGATVQGSNRRVTFGGKSSVTVPAGAEMFSDAVRVDWASGGDDDHADSAVEGRNLAVSMFLPGTQGPMTFHGTALQESFIGAPGSGDHAEEDVDDNYPYETSSWFFVDAVDVMAPSDTRVLVGAGSSSVDGSITTPGNNDRFLNWMSRKLHEAFGQHVSVVNEGIGGDVAATPGPGQTRPLPQVLPERFDRDILGVSGATDVLFYAGTNDIGDGIPSAQSIASLQSMVAKLHARGIKAVGGTLITNVGQAGTNAATYTAHNDINQFILARGNFDSTADFYNKTRDPLNTDFLTTTLQLQYATHSDPTGTPDFLHLGRAGAEAEAATLDLSFFKPARR